MKVRQKYSKEFKLEALGRLQQGDKSVTELAFELGLRRNQLYLWQQQLQKTGPDSFAPKPGRKKHSESDELTRLRKELKMSRWFTLIAIQDQKSSWAEKFRAN